MDIPLRVLIIEDSDRDVALEVRALKAADYQVTYAVVETAAEMQAALLKQAFDIVISDHDLPQFDAHGALAVLKQSGLDIPFIVVSGTIGEETAVELMKAGASDYVMKDRLSRLVPSIQKELREAESRREYKRLEEARRNEQIMLARTEGIAHVGSWEWDIAMNTVIWSNELFQIFQREPQEGAPSFAEHQAFYHPDDMVLLRQAVEAAVADGTPYELELRAIRKDGEIRVCVARGVVEMALGGRPVRLFGSLQDITERKAAEETLKEEKAFIENTLNTMQDVFFVFDLEGRYLRWNNTMSAVSGYTDTEIALMKPTDFFRKEDAERVSGAIEKVLKKGSYKIEAPVVTKDGRQIPYEFMASVLRDHNGNLIGISGVGRDLTERKQAEDALKNSEKEFRLLAESMPQIVWVTRPDGWPTYFNHQWMDYTGLKLEDGHGWNKPFHPDDQKRAWDAWQNATKYGVTYSLECRLRRADGVYKWWLVRGVPVMDEHGAVLKWFGTWTDIDDMKRAAEELKKSEERFRTAVENLTDIIFEWDIKERITWYGDIDSIMGYPPEGFPRTMEGWKATIHPEDKDRLMTAVEAQLEDVEPYAAEYRVRRGDGEWRWCSARATAVRDDQGKPYKLVGSITDITKIKLAEEEKLKLEAQLRQAQKMEAIGTLAGGVAHDFNNILNIILGYGNMVMNTLEADSQSMENMREVLIAAERAANLTKRLLAFSRKQVVEVKPININDLILGLQKMLVLIIRENIELNLDLADRPMIVLTDFGQIEQVLMNLASNARDAMPEGGRLTIGTGIQEIDDKYAASYGYGKPGTYALITVGDTGHGMDAETQKKIFEPFFTTKGIGQGTGLGLAVSYGIIKQHGGYIRAYSEPGQGTVFKIYLPLVEETADKDKEAAAVVPVNGGNETILIAEDDASLRKLKRIVLESYGYSIISAVDGEDAIAQFMKNSDKIQLAILDMVMPKKNGKEVSEAIRKVSPRTRIIFTSGYTMDIVKTWELMESGFEFLLKPIASRDLLKKVREVLDR